MKEEDYIKMAHQLTMTKYNNMFIVLESIFDDDDTESIPLEVSGYVNDWKIDKDGNKLINSIDINSVDYIYHNPFTNKENINIDEIP